MVPLLSFSLARHGTVRARSLVRLARGARRSGQGLVAVVPASHSAARAARDGGVAGALEALEAGGALTVCVALAYAGLEIGRGRVIAAGQHSRVEVVSALVKVVSALARGAVVLETAPRLHELHDAVRARASVSLVGDTKMRRKHQAWLRVNRMMTPPRLLPPSLSLSPLPLLPRSSLSSSSSRHGLPRPAACARELSLSCKIGSKTCAVSSRSQTQDGGKGHISLPLPLAPLGSAAPLHHGWHSGAHTPGPALSAQPETGKWVAVDMAKRPWAGWVGTAALPLLPCSFFVRTTHVLDPLK